MIELHSYDCAVFLLINRYYLRLICDTINMMYMWNDIVILQEGVRVYMGTYFNPSNESFTCDKNSKIYMDKTGLLDYLNDVICTNGKMYCCQPCQTFW